MSGLLEQLPVDIDLTPDAVAGYLGATGWLLDAADDSRQVWRQDEGPRRARLMLPLDRRFVDFEDRFAEALRRLCLIHDWDITQLATNVLGARSDFLYVRADQATADGSIPLRQAEQLLTGAVQMLTAAALATIEPKAVFPGRRPEIVRRFVDDDVRMGHTLRGSFVITILTRLGDDESVPTEIESSGEISDEITSTEFESELQSNEVTSGSIPEMTIPPFQRRVMATLSSGLRAVSEVAVEIERTRASLERAVDRGLSADLCDSIVEMTRFEGLRALDMSFQWAPAERVPPPSDRQVVINRDVLPELPRISERLREAPLKTRESLYGQVVRLDRSDEDYGVVTVRGIIGRSTRRQARLYLRGGEYNRAIRAHRGRRSVLVTGELERKGNTYWFSEGFTFEVLS